MSNAEKRPDISIMFDALDGVNRGVSFVAFAELAPLSVRVQLRADLEAVAQAARDREAQPGEVDVLPMRFCLATQRPAEDSAAWQVRIACGLREEPTATPQCVIYDAQNSSAYMLRDRAVDRAGMHAFLASFWAGELQDEAV